MKHRMICFALTALLLGGFGSLKAAAGEKFSCPVDFAAGGTPAYQGSVGLGVTPPSTVDFAADGTHSSLVDFAAGGTPAYQGDWALLGGDATKDSVWGKVDSLLEREYFNEAYSLATKLYDHYCKVHDERQMLVGADRLGQINMAMHEEAFDSVLVRYTFLSEQLHGVELAICQLRVAYYYMQYLQRNRWLVMKNKPTDEAALPYTAWDRERMLDTIQHRVEAAFAQRELLKATGAEELRPIARLVGDDSCRYDNVSCFELMVDYVATLYAELKRLDEWNFGQAEDLLGRPELFVAMPLPARMEGEMKMRCYQLALLQEVEEMYLRGDFPAGGTPASQGASGEERLMKRYFLRKGAVVGMVNLSGEILRKGNMDALMRFGHLKCPDAGHLYYDMALSAKDEVEELRYLDSVIARFAKSHWAALCENRKKEIMNSVLTMTMEETVAAERDWMALAEYKNLDKIYFRIVKDETKSNCRGCLDEKTILKQQVVLSWNMAVERGDDYKWRRVYVPISCLKEGKPLPAGRYILLASDNSNFSKGFVYSKFRVSALSVVKINNSFNGFVVDRRSGKPIAGAEVTLQYAKNGKTFGVMVSVRTNEEGYYDLDGAIGKTVSAKLKEGCYKATVAYKGEVVEGWTDWRYRDYEEVSASIKSTAMMDRPVYKPGDTLHFAAIAYVDSSDRITKRAMEGGKIRVTLYDINRNVVDSLQGVTDAYGCFSGQMKIGEDATPGYYELNGEVVKGKDEGRFYQHVRVEAYKQPKFMVAMAADSVRRSLGQPVRITGTATTYSGVPLQGAKVSYSVERSERSMWWRWNSYGGDKQTIAHGNMEVDNEGRFEISFEATGDSNHLRATHNMYRYTVTAEVTDINGETHSASITIPIGYRNSYLAINKEGDEGKERLVVQHYNLDGVAVDGRVRVKVYRLQQPERPLLPMAVIELAKKEAKMTLGEKEFAARFPLFDRDGSANDLSRWAVGAKVWESEAEVGTAKPLRIDLQKMPAGAYKIEALLLAGGDDTMSVTEYQIHIPEGSKKVVESRLLWSRPGKQSLRVGDTARICIGSRFDAVTVYMCEGYDLKRFRNSVHKIDNETKCIAIPVTEEMQGGLTVELFALKENHLEKVKYVFDVAYRDSELEISIDSLQQVMQPGGEVEWTVRIGAKQGGGALAGALLMTLYDHSIDSYGGHSFYMNPWYNNSRYRLLEVGNMSTTSYCNGNYWKHTIDYTYHPAPCQREWQLYQSWESPYRYHHVMYKGASSLRAVQRVSSNSMADMATDEVAEHEEVFALAMGESGDAYQMEEAELAEEVVTVLDTEAGDEGKEMEYRGNHSTLAYFGSMQSDSTGAVTVRFRMPGLLTEWSLKAFGWNQRMAVGSYSGSLKTQKVLMVEPTVPRYLRQGDSCQLSVKVVNQSERADTVAVQLTLLDAKGGVEMKAVKGAAVGGDAFAAGNEATLALGPKSSGEVVFSLVVPEGNIYMCRYRLKAQGGKESDGEEGVIPLLPSRQLVTESMSFYINGAGEKKYTMSSLVRQGGDEGSTTLRHYALTVDATPNPIWMAMQALPYVQQQKNPSNIYLANSIYTNLLALKIVEDNPGLEKLFKEWRQAGGDAMQSELDRNSEVKQTVVSETPWLADADNEAARKRDMARYFEPLMLQREVNQSMKLLVESQRADGGWSWIAGDRRSSVYVTQYILKFLGELQRLGVEIDKKLSHALDKALAYVDDETYKQYVRYEKGRNISPVHLDYLYMKSLYPSAKSSKQHAAMYKFYYDNAKKNNSLYRDLWSQSELALVFHRGGDKALARDMAKRLLQKSLYSDEMGLYWRDNLSGYYWYERPIETQAMLIKTIGEVLGDRESVAKMQQWLLKQKQTTCWSSDVATVRAIEALLDGGEKRMGRVDQSSWMEVHYGTHVLQSDTTRHDIHITARLSGDEVQPGDGEVTIVKHDDGIAWGAMYWQYFERVDKVQASNMGVTMTRKLYRVNNDGTLTLLPEKDGTVTAHVGDRIKVKIHLRCDRSLEYVELTEPRAATMEPVSTASGWRWNSGLSYYISITNTKQTLYINQLDKGQYDIEYEMYVTSGGRYISAPGTVQCLYAPEFRAVCPMPTINVER